jgi:hypothetical protein
MPSATRRRSAARTTLHTAGAVVLAGTAVVHGSLGGNAVTTRRRTDAFSSVARGYVLVMARRVTSTRPRPSGRARAATLLAAAATSACLLCGCGGVASADPVHAIRADWTRFFDGRTPVGTRTTLVQKGCALRPVLRRLSAVPVSRSVSASVSKVRVVSPSTATVRYDVFVSGVVQLAGQEGTAVKQDGVWKVGLGTVCRLLAIERASPPICEQAAATTPLR